MEAENNHCCYYYFGRINLKADVDYYNIPIVLYFINKAIFCLFSREKKNYGA